MKNKTKKTYQTSYRKQLIQLAKLYRIVEIKNYLKSAKKLTTSQIELILIKNKIKLPLKKTLSNLESIIFFKNKYINQLYYSLLVAVIFVGFFGGLPYLIQSFHKIDSSLWKDKKEIARYKNDSIDKILKKNEIKLNKSEENLPEIVVRPKSKEDLIDNTISLSASVVATLFKDHNYDLSKIRKGQKVKPFYISLLPKDISLVEDVKERKELFIKIILPLILQENDQIKKDRKKLFKLLAKKVNNKEEKNL